MITDTTSSGFTFSIEDEIVDDMEMLDLFVEADENPLVFPKVITKLLGAEQKKRFYDHLRTESGHVPASKVMDEMMDIISASGKSGKKS